MATWLIRYTASQFATLPSRVNSDTLRKASKPRELVMQPLGFTSQPRGIARQLALSIAFYRYGNSSLPLRVNGAVHRFIERWTAVNMGQFTRGVSRSNAVYTAVYAPLTPHGAPTKKIFRKLFGIPNEPVAFWSVYPWA